jgi:CheY-like chemotaxis protein
MIDDNEEFCRATQREFSLMEHNIEYETSAKEGIDKAIAGEYDIIIVDKIMPEMDGIEVCKAIQNKSPNATLAIFTGESNIDPKELQNLFPHPLVLQKPFDIEDVEAACFSEVKSPAQKVPEVTRHQEETEIDTSSSIHKESIETFFVKEVERMAQQIKCMSWGAFEWDESEQRLVVLKTYGFRNNNLQDKMQVELNYTPIRNVAEAGQIVITNRFSECKITFKNWCKHLETWLDFESIICHPVLSKEKPRYAAVFSSVYSDQFPDLSTQKIESWAEVVSAKINTKEAYIQLERVQRMALRGEITSSLTHELRNRLGIISMSLKSISRCSPRIYHKLRLQKTDIPEEMQTLDEAAKQAINATEQVGDVITAFSETN